jgi:hypothetical protein
MDKEQVWDYLVESQIATEEELKLVTYINGYSIESLESVIYVRTGYRSIDQLLDLDEEEEEKTQ